MKKKTLREEIRAQEIKAQELKVKKEEEAFFKNISIEDKLKLFPLKDDIIYGNNEKKKEACIFISFIVYCILEKDGKIITLSEKEHELKEYLSKYSDAKKSDELKESLKDNKNGKVEKINDYYFFQFSKYQEVCQEDGNDEQSSNNEYEKNFRIEDAIEQLENILFFNNIKINDFYEEYDEVCNHTAEFINFIKKTLREEVFVSRHFVQKKNKKIVNLTTKKEEEITIENVKVNETFSMKSHIGRKIYNQYDNEDEINDDEIEYENTTNETKYNDGNNDVVYILSEYSKEINNKILESIQNQDLIKKLTICYYDHKNYIESDINLSPSDMKLLRLISNYIDCDEVKKIQNEFGYLSPLDKRKTIESSLDNMHFWESFYNKNKNYIENFKYEEEKKKISQSDQLKKQVFRSKDENIKKFSKIAETYLKEQNIKVEDTLKETILMMYKLLFLTTGGNMTKKEIELFAKKIREQKSCSKYREYIYLDVIGLLSDKDKTILNEHLKKCKICKLYKENVSLGKKYRTDRNKHILSEIKQNPYLQTSEKSEEEYNNEMIQEEYYRGLIRTKSETYLNYYILSLIKNGEIGKAKEIIDNPKKFISELV